MSTRAVHWHAGMFLRPQHFQAAQRHALHQGNRSEKWDVHYNWGIRTLELDFNALGNYRFVVHKLRARLRDGTLVSIPEDGNIGEVDLREALASSNNVTIYLAVPGFHMGRANISVDSEGPPSRFVIETQPIEDENTGSNQQELQIRRLNFKLLASTQNLGGYELLPIARVVKSSGAEPLPVLDTEYIPPVLACDAWQLLGEGVLQGIHERVGKKLETIVNQVLARSISFETHNQNDALAFAQLRVLNEAYALLGILAYALGIHPLQAYLELSRLTGQLAIFGATRRFPAVPRYDHDDLAKCFFTVRDAINEIFDVMIEPEYRERPFIGAGLRMQVTLEPAWLESNWDMYIGVQSMLPADEVLRLLQPGQLDLKISSSDRVEAIFREGQAGLRFVPSPNAPRFLPMLPGQSYLQVSREGPEWPNVQRMLSLAIRVNENMITGSLQGQRRLMVKTGGQTASFQFTLYVIPH